MTIKPLAEDYEKAIDVLLGHFPHVPTDLRELAYKYASQRQPHPVAGEVEELLIEAQQFIEGFAESSESGFARQRKAQQWLNRYMQLKREGGR